MSGYQRGPATQDHAPRPPRDLPRQKKELSPEELALMMECTRESLFYRVVPLTACNLGLVFYGLSKGYIKSHPRWGPTPGIFGAMVAGFFIGKASYVGPCKKKFIERLPNSELSKAFLKAKGVRVDEEISGYEQNPVMGTTRRRPDENQRRLDVDTHSRPEARGLDDSFRPSLDREVKLQSPDSQKQPSVTFEELRQRNRAQPPSKTNVLRDPLESEPIRRPRRRASPDQGPKNKYGDEWDDN